MIEIKVYIGEIWWKLDGSAMVYIHWRTAKNNLGKRFDPPPFWAMPKFTWVFFGWGFPKNALLEQVSEVQKLKEKILFSNLTSLQLLVPLLLLIMSPLHLLLLHLSLPPSFLPLHPLLINISWCNHGHHHLCDNKHIFDETSLIKTFQPGRLSGQSFPWCKFWNGAVSTRIQPHCKENTTWQFCTIGPGGIGVGLEWDGSQHGHPKPRPIFLSHHCFCTKNKCSKFQH